MRRHSKQECRVDTGYHTRVGKCHVESLWIWNRVKLRCRIPFCVADILSFNLVGCREIVTWIWMWKQHCNIVRMEITISVFWSRLWHEIASFSNIYQTIWALYLIYLCNPFQYLIISKADFRISRAGTSIGLKILHPLDSASMQYQNSKISVSPTHLHTLRHTHRHTLSHKCILLTTQHS